MEAYETKVEITDEVIKVHCNGNAKTIHSSSMDDLFIALRYILSIMNLESSYYNSIIKVKEICLVYVEKQNLTQMYTQV